MKRTKFAQKRRFTRDDHLHVSLPPFLCAGLDLTNRKCGRILMEVCRQMPISMSIILDLIPIPVCVHTHTVRFDLDLLERMQTRISCAV